MELHEIEDCFFVTIGANDGCTGDPLYEHIIKYNWHGICVEPNPIPFRYLQQTYAGNPNIILEQAAISDTTGEATLYYPASTDTDSYMGGCPNWMQSQLSSLSSGQGKYNTVTVNTMTPRELLQKYNVQKVDVLLIDTEGWDFTILKAFPFDLFMPKWVQVEIRHVPNQEEVNPYLQQLGYKTNMDSSGMDLIGILPLNSSICDIL